MDERRKYFRFEGPINIKYTLDDKRKRGRALTNNISKGGVSFNTSKNITNNDNIRMEFDIPGDNMPVFGEGSVVWIKKNKNDKKRPFDVGVKLIDMARSDKSRILEYAYKQWLKLKNLRTMV